MPSATQMAAAKHCPWMTAATEHSPEVPLLQSTEMSAENIADDIADDIADKDIVEGETENRRTRIKIENRRLKVAPKVAPVAPPPEPPATPYCAAFPLCLSYGGCTSPPAPPGLPAPPRKPGGALPAKAPPGASLVGPCQLSEEAKESSLKNIEDGMKFFNNQSGHTLNLIKAQGDQFKVQSAQIQALSEQLKVQSAQIQAQSASAQIQSEQLKEMTLMLLRVVPLAWE